MSEQANKSCPLCGRTDGVEVTSFIDQVPDKWRVTCRRCGDYRIVSEARLALRGLPNLHRLSGLTREATERERASRRQQRQPQQLIDISTGLDPNELDRFFDQTPQNGDNLGRARRLLAAVQRRSNEPEFDGRINVDVDYPLAYARGPEELLVIVNFAVNLRWLIASSNTQPLLIQLTPEGQAEVL